MTEDTKHTSSAGDSEALDDTGSSVLAAEPPPPGDSASPNEIADRDPTSPTKDREKPTEGAPESTEGSSKPIRTSDENDAKPPREPDGRDRETLFWRMAPYVIGLGLLGELFYFGYRAEVQVCVAKKGAHDFALLGQQRTDQNRWKFPSCEQRLNLGFSNRFDEVVEDAKKVACRRATMLRYRKETRDCTAGRQHWETQIKTSQMPPWDPRFYRALLGID